MRGRLMRRPGPTKRREICAFVSIAATRSATTAAPMIKVGAMFGLKRHRVVQLNFIVPGAQKSGTTALHYFLRKHPQIALPDRKEMHFFDDEGIFSHQPVDYELLHRHFRVRAALA